jgi:hypothetical protein
MTIEDKDARELIDKIEIVLGLWETDQIAPRMLLDLKHIETSFRELKKITYKLHGQLWRARP